MVLRSARALLRACAGSASALVVACAASLLMAGCGCVIGSDDFCDGDRRTEDGDCGAASVACVRSCTFANDYRQYVDADCRGGHQICPDGTVTVESCLD